MRTSLLWIGVFAILAASCSQGGSLQTPVPSIPTLQAVPTLKPAVIPTSEVEAISGFDPIMTNPADGAVLIDVPAGGFWMGAAPETGLAICEDSRAGCNLEDFEDESPVHLVELPGYLIYQTEVTNNQYQLCVDAAVCPLPAFLEFYSDQRFNDHPVVYVDWYSAKTYCTWAGGRLPSEAEWEKAARGADERIFPWGDEKVCGFANLKGCTQGLTMPVGSFPDAASPFGVLDMAGNAAEWIGDWYDPEYYTVSPLVDPIGPNGGEMRVARGGSWKNPFTGVRVTNRTANYPEVYSSGTGFRCVLSKIKNP